MRFSPIYSTAIFSDDEEIGGRLAGCYNRLRGVWKVGGRDGRV